MRPAALRLVASLALPLAAGCAPASPASAGAPASPAGAAVTPAIVVDQAIAAPLTSLGLTGVIAWKDHGAPQIHCSDRADCEARTLPASTFKIANALIALDAGLVSGPDESFPWDGVRRSFDDWNRDHTLRSAFAASSVPVFQGIARRVGLERFKASLPRFGYGNAQTGDRVDSFWLEGPLAISPVEQIAFLERLEGKTLPVRDEAREAVRDILVRERRGDATLRGKTGWSGPGTPGEIGWFVGYSTRGPRTTYVAVRARRPPGFDEKTFLRGRIEAAKSALEAQGAY